MPGRPTLTLFCGLPGSGKTTLARRLEADGAGLRLCTDDWQHAIGIGWDDPDGHERLQVVLREHAFALLDSGVDVILEDGLWLAAERTAMFAAGREHGARLAWHLLDTDPDTLWHRLEQRNATAASGAYPLTRADLDSARSVFEPPTDAELDAVDEAWRHRPDGSAERLR
ncbi:hypothetical protein FHX74_001595 [Friedmanniella endophytica]|uniref:AAA domain-containing protein n=1 Tax=Microlunatus kandeliicorticis TaxID=1759536 RepID=A0A7W3IRS7_9ACTN|nr:ATP-binding protein [Microlunatus kandeliicorticis]MBA8793990.1 hypothetical protein [Microlunatus kandeliicorticis]